MQKQGLRVYSEIQWFIMNTSQHSGLFWLSYETFNYVIINVFWC